MQSPKFSVGEICLTYTTAYPELSGKSSTVIDREFRPDGGFYYIIELTGCDVWWAEHLLHKPQKASDFNFNSLLEDLKSGIKTEITETL